MTFKVGDIVKYKAQFLRDIGWYTDVPINGIVRSVKNLLCLVEWSDGTEGNVIKENLMPFDTPDLH